MLGPTRPLKEDLMIRRHLSYANVAATLALLLSLSGIAYAAALPRNSVGPRELKDDAVRTAQVKDFALRLRDLQGVITGGRQTVNSQINVPAGGCEGEGLGSTNPLEPGWIGSMVVGHLTDEEGDAVLPNNGVVVPTMVSETSQGGAIANLLVCDMGSGGQTVPAGSVFRYRLVTR
jgi:hypothetical protein